MTTTSPPSTKPSHRRQRSSHTIAVVTPFLLLLTHASISTTTSAFRTPISTTSPSVPRIRRRHHCTPILSSTGWRSRTSDERTERRSSNHDEADTENNHGKHPKHRWKHEPFDFSSRYGWDSFYKHGLIDRTKDSRERDTIDNERIESNPNENLDDVRIKGSAIINEETIESLEYEWHGHIPHSVIVQTIAPSVVAAHEYYHSQRERQTHQQPQPHEHKMANDHPNPSTSYKTMPSILILGCGNSSLPRILHDALLPTTPVRVTCLDYSPVCIDMISQMYGPSRPDMEFVVGDATNLKESLMKGKVEEEAVEYDVIVDKGLLDALLCGEGFDQDVERLVGGIREVLTKERWGMHVLVCFRLSRSLKESLVELGTIGRVDTVSSHGGHVVAGAQNGDDDDSDGFDNTALFWEFDIPVEGSEKGRASFNLATRCEERKSMYELKMLCTDWKLS